MLKKIIFTLIKTPSWVLHKYINLLSIISDKAQFMVIDYHTNYLNDVTLNVKHTSGNDKIISMDFYTPNSLCKFRRDTFSTKEPETLSWIEEFGKNNALLFDIGANVGIYSIYHAKLNNAKCIAFEPSVFNLQLLAKNININNAQDLITVINNPLSSQTGVSNFLYGNLTEGGALSAFDVDFGFDGKQIKNDLKLKVAGFSLDDMIETGVIKEIPDFIKIDVDGIEHIILSGAKKVLSNNKCKSVLIEVNVNFQEQAIGVEKILKECGFSLRESLHGEMFENSTKFSNTYNHIWVK